MSNDELFVPGLVSVTYRQLGVDQVISCAAAAGLSCIEWGGDIHVPHADVDRARTVSAQARSRGLASACYGSYLRLGVNPDRAIDEQVVATAAALGAPAVRVWAGDVPSSTATARHRDAVADHARRVSELARAIGLDLVVEYHADTLTDTASSALDLLNDIGRDNVFLGWQPPNHMDFAGRLASLDAVADRCRDIHVFNWSMTPSGSIERHPLAEAAEDWKAYFGRLAETGILRRALLEFVPGDDPQVLGREAATLLELLRPWSAATGTGPCEKQNAPSEWSPQ